jgi:DNA-binding SARP family transcriptional activator
MEKLIVRLQRGDTTDTAIVERLLEAIAKRSYPHLLHYEWFMPVDYRVREAQRTLIAHVVSAASAKSDFETVLRMAKILVDEDHCDEWGHELIIRYHISNGNHNEALREYQRYREVLQEQLGTQPSQALTQFIQSVAV